MCCREGMLAAYAARPPRMPVGQRGSLADRRGNHARTWEGSHSRRAGDLALGRIASLSIAFLTRASIGWCKNGLTGKFQWSIIATEQWRQYRPGPRRQPPNEGCVRVGIVSQSASVTIEIEQVDLPSAAARLDLEGSRQQQKRMDEPRERGAPLAVANLSLVAVTDRRLFDPPAETSHHLACLGHVPGSPVPAPGQSARRRSYR